jgi:hypothetical protein
MLQAKWVVRLRVAARLGLALIACLVAAGDAGSQERHNGSASWNYVLSHDTQAPNGQDNWRWCQKCGVLHYGGNAPGPCPSGGVHDRGPSWNYVLSHDTQVPNGQDNWRWCQRCGMLHYGGNTGGRCPAR